MTWPITPPVLLPVSVSRFRLFLGLCGFFWRYVFDVLGHGIWFHLPYKVTGRGSLLNQWFCFGALGLIRFWLWFIFDIWRA